MTSVVVAPYMFVLVLTKALNVPLVIGCRVGPVVQLLTVDTEGQCRWSLLPPVGSDPVEVGDQFRDPAAGPMV